MGGRPAEFFAVIAGEGETVDFGVVADVHGQVALEVNMRDGAEMRKFGSEALEFGDEFFPIGFGFGKMAALGLDDERGDLAATLFRMGGIA